LRAKWSHAGRALGEHGERQAERLDCKGLAAMFAIAHGALSLKFQVAGTQLKQGTRMGRSGGGHGFAWRIGNVPVAWFVRGCWRAGRPLSLRGGESGGGNDSRLRGGIPARAPESTRGGACAPRCACGAGGGLSAWGRPDLPARDAPATDWRETPLPHPPSTIPYPQSPIFLATLASWR
jgi:hypothetical protein